MTINFLIQEISGIHNKNELIKRKTGGYYNIFEIAGIATDEVKMCRVIYDLINPKGRHSQGNTYLKLFIEHVLKLHIPLLENVQVYRELLIEKNRRIDLFIEAKGYKIPIEVKINARDQENQCEDYAKVALNSNVYYLTKFGTMPSTYSSKDQNIVTPISFAHDILLWLKKCLEQSDTIKLAPIREVLLQLIVVIKKFTGQMEDENQMDIKTVLTSSPESMKSAFAIEQSLSVIKLDKLKSIFNEIEKRIGKEKLQNEYDWEFNNYKRHNTYYSSKSYTYPGISYPYKTNIRPGIDIWFRIELEDYIFAGFVVANNGKLEDQKLTEKEIKKCLPHIVPKIDSYWAYWEYLPNDEDAPNFKYPEENDLYFKLYDDRYYENFINECIKKINMIFNS
ncbi:PD-(D/E)XK nuclease family protein [Ureibacillus sp. Re31]|uniref:PD-(D/E)XK nuclease family protein n=1 Tax=Ureibacillus galli TaxID=2762222 RepID=A0ABR8XAI3_9BACL|nr:PD-(D/E)XK nuclease family protein [Ureibacillus galli]MBD8026329.1 PD-(D/E)XK nuclease family protein [Ureibacillus galli]